MYLILSDVNDNVTPEVFHNGVDVINLRVAGEEKGRRKRFDGESSTEKIRLRDMSRRSTGEDPSEKIKLRRSA